MQQNLLPYHVQLVKQNRFDLYYSALFAGDKAFDLMAIYAFYIEFESIETKTSELMTVLIRLTWWSEAIESIYNNETIEHQTLKSLMIVIKKYNLPKSYFLNIVEGYHLLVEDQSKDQSAKMIGENLIDLAAKIIDPTNQNNSQISPIGTAYVKYYWRQNHNFNKFDIESDLINLGKADLNNYQTLKAILLIRSLIKYYLKYWPKQPSKMMIMLRLIYFNIFKQL